MAHEGDSGRPKMMQGMNMTERTASRIDEGQKTAATTDTKSAVADSRLRCGEDCGARGRTSTQPGGFINALDQADCASGASERRSATASRRSARAIHPMKS